MPPVLVSLSKSIGHEIELTSSQGLQGVFKPREDRANLPLSADTAQAMLPPNACVFVAKYVTIALLSETDLNLIA